MSQNNQTAPTAQLATTENNSVSIFNDSNAFAHAQRIATMLAQSDIIPSNYKNNLPNVLVAMEMAHRIGASPLAVMQNMNVIHGRPSWSSTFIIASINTCGRFKPLRFKFEGTGENKSCLAYTTDTNGELLEGPPASIAMAKKEGWFGKSGSKWQSMPDLMLQYRAAAFFGRLYAPDVLLGMQSADEIEDVSAGSNTSTPAPTIEVLKDEVNKRVRKTKEPKTETVVATPVHTDEELL